MSVNEIKALCSIVSDSIAILVYLHNQTDSLTILLIDHDGLKDYRDQRISVQELYELGRKIEYVLGSMSLLFANNRGAQLLEDIEYSIEKESVLQYAGRVLLPFGDRLKEYKHLLIVPALNISSIPFWVINPFSDSSMFIENLSYSIAPSLQTVFNFIFGYTNRSGLFGQVKVRWTFENPLLIGLSEFGTCDSIQFQDLPGALNEIATLSEKIPNAHVLLNDDATRQNILDLMSSADFIYFATHGMSSQARPLDDSYLVLHGDSCRNDCLTPREIQVMDLDNTELVVLSACQTGLGKSHAGGTIGIARAFQLAGARNVVMSLWSIDDKATVGLMTEFISEIQKENQYFPGEALRQAILNYRLKDPNPAHWAAFATFGVTY